MADDDVVIEHPNRRKAASQLTRVLVVVLLLVSAVVLTVILVGGWSKIEAKPLQVAFIVVELLLAVWVVRWSRGALPMAAGAGVVIGIFAVVAAPGWFSRDAPGFSNPGLGASFLGLLCVLLALAQLLLIVTALVGFRQAWNVEVERPRGERGEREPEPAPA